MSVASRWIVTDTKGSARKSDGDRPSGNVSSWVPLGRIHLDDPDVGLTESYAPTSSSTWRVLADQLDASALECLDDLHQRVDDTADLSARRFHALDRRQRKAGHFGQLPLVDAKQ